MKVWKLGTRWGNNAPNFYDLLISHKIVLTDGASTFEKGDYIIITDGFLVKAIAQVTDTLKYVTEDNSLKAPFETYRIPYSDNDVRFVKATFKELTKEEQFKYELMKGIAQVRSPTIIKRVYQLMGRLIDIHDKCFEYLNPLHRTQPHFHFRLRSNNAKERLSKGYWFLGDDETCIITFWNGEDTIANTPNIYLKINSMGETTLVLCGKAEEVKGKFLAAVALAVGGMIQYKEKGNFINYWERAFSGENYLDSLEKFLARDKLLIDLLLSYQEGKLGDLSAIPADKFATQLEMVWKYKGSFTAPKPRDEKRQNVELQLKKMTLKNIGHFDELEIDLTPRVICLLGYNGTGKTTLLRALALGLTGAEETTVLDTKHIRIQRLLRLSAPTTDGVLNYYHEGSIEVEYNLDKTYINKIALTKDIGDVGTSSKVQLKDISTTPSFAFTYNKDLYKQLFMGFPQVQNVFSDSTPIVEKKPNINDILPLLYDEVDNRFESFSDWLMDLQADSLTNVKNEKYILDFIFGVISELIDEKMVLATVQHQEKMIWVKLEQDPEEKLFNLLSQGFKSAFTWIGHLVRRLAEANDFDTDFHQKPALILIDEIDTYLHPKWQSKILNVLANYFPNAQFIVTTHSPFVANYAKLPNNEQVVVYRIDKNYDKDRNIYTNKIRKFEKTYGRDMTNIFYDWMDMKRIPSEMAAQLHQIDLWAEQETEESIQKAETLLKKLEPYFESTDESWVGAKTTVTLAKENLLWTKENKD